MNFTEKLRSSKSLVLGAKFSAAIFREKDKTFCTSLAFMEDLLLKFDEAVQIIENNKGHYGSPLLEKHAEHFLGRVRGDIV